jgi:hypothetical protein
LSRRVAYTFDLQVSNSPGWGFAVDDYNKGANQVVAEDFGHTSIVERHVVILPNALIVGQPIPQVVHSL